jgi:hypothetical protein
MSDDPDDYDVDTPYLRAKIEILIPGLRLPTNEKKLLGELMDAIEQVGMILFRNHDPDGYALYVANHPEDDDDPEDDEDDDEEDEPVQAKVIPFRKSGS